MSDASSPRLLLLGTAAVVSIYAAGHARTRAAALRLDAEDAARQRPVVVQRPVADTARPASVAEPVAAPSAAAVTAKATAPEPRVVATPGEEPVVSVPPVESVSTAAAPVPVPPPAAPPADTVIAPAAPAAPKWRDGTYTGWGDSRHGSIEATVTIRAGRIADAYISRCLTRYSCSWIEHLQIQVVDRQGPEVDFVSGATQSVNAFYYAVVEALKVAARP